MKPILTILSGILGTASQLSLLEAATSPSATACGVFCALAGATILCAALRWRMEAAR